MAKERILVADDEAHMRFLISELLKREDYEVIEAANGKEAVEKCNSDEVDLVILDYKMPVMDGLEALSAIVDSDSKMIVIMVTAHDTKNLARDAIRLGAYDYFTKPFDLDEMRIIIRRALEKRALQQQVTHLAEEIDTQIQNTQIVGRATSMKPVFDTIDKVAFSDVTVLITGESGTGKELIAKAIHYASARRDMPFIALNCAAIPENLLESELFGHEKGSFTGAVTRKIGKFELADKGTLFLDEIGDMNFSTQAKILRVLQEREYQRVGGTRTLSSSARIVSATNKNLQQAVRDGAFREDLYFRLNVIPVHSPPLRQRREDIPELVSHFIRLGNTRFDTNIQQVSPDTLDILIQYPWPGNIRQLENVIYRATIMASGATIVKEDLPVEILEPQPIVALEPVDSPMQSPSENGTTLQSHTKQMTENMEKQMILQALEEYKWRRGQTADKLGISRRSLLRKMIKYEIQ